MTRPFINIIPSSSSSSSIISSIFYFFNYYAEMLLLKGTLCQVFPRHSAIAPSGGPFLEVFI